MRRLEVIFNKYGRFLARHPLPFLIVPIIITLVSCVGLLNFHSQDDIWDIYAPLNALSRVEEAAQNDFEYIAANHHYRIQILVDRKDGGNLMDAQSLQEIADVNKFITDNVTVSNGQRSFHYRELCGIYCNESNSFAIGFVQAAMQQQSSLFSFKFTYPTAQALNNPVFLGYSIGNIETKKEEGEDVVSSFKLFILHYMIDIDLPGGRHLANDFERKLMKLFEAANNESSILNFALLSRNRELYEQRRITTTAIPFLGLTGLVLTAFMLVTLLDDPLYKSQCIEALFGVISPGMALITTFGLVWGCGLPFSNILTVVPFLVVTIGIDDAFLILAGWRQSDPNKSLEERIGESLEKSGASVSVTSITDVLCFGVGVISNMPVVQLFCVYTSIALAIDFIYQITFFSAIVVYCGKRQILLEESHRASTDSSLTGSISSRGSWKSRLLRNAEKLTRVFGTQQVHPGQESNVVANPINTLRHSNQWLAKFVKFLHSKFGQCFVIATFIFHLSASIYLCTQVNNDFDMENLYLRESPLTPVSQKMQKFALGESFVVNFVLHPMGSFQDEKRRDSFHKMIEELEAIPKYGMGNRGTNVWTREYESSAQFWAQEGEEIWSPVNVYNNYHQFNLDPKNIVARKLQNGSSVIDSFTWHITYHNMSRFVDVMELLTERRAILSRYANEFHVTSHHPLEKVPTESAASAPYNFMQTAVSAILLMSVLVFFFIMDAEAIFSVVLSILSISCGTVGYLHLWGVNLDAVSLISMLMSIGFSVDYSAHICYHYYTFRQDDEETQEEMERAREAMKVKPTRITIGADSLDCEKKGGDFNTMHSIIHTTVQSARKYKFDTYDRLYHTFGGVGWPVIQSGLSTVLGMIPLFWVQAYVVEVFWKTIILVTFLGMYHALFLLPAFFIQFAEVRHFLKRCFSCCTRRKGGDTN